MGDKASGLTTENNRLYAAIASYNNTLVPAYMALLQGYGLTEPITLAQLEGLTVKRRHTEHAMKRPYWKRVMVAIDQLANAILGGDEDETISSRIGKKVRATGREKRLHTTCAGSCTFWTLTTA